MFIYEFWIYKLLQIGARIGSIWSMVQDLCVGSFRFKSELQTKLINSILYFWNNHNSVIVITKNQKEGKAIRADFLPHWFFVHIFSRRGFIFSFSFLFFKLSYLSRLKSYFESDYDVGNLSTSSSHLHKNWISKLVLELVSWRDKIPILFDIFFTKGLEIEKISHLIWLSDWILCERITERSKRKQKSS